MAPTIRVAAARWNAQRPLRLQRRTDDADGLERPASPNGGADGGAGPDGPANRQAAAPAATSTAAPTASFPQATSDHDATVFTTPAAQC